MTNKGMAAINEALTVVEKVPTTFSESGQSVPTTTLMILNFVLQIVNHAQDNKEAICRMLNHGGGKEKLDMSDDQLIALYVGNVCHKLAEVTSRLSLMPPGYPMERLIKLVNGELDTLNAKVEKNGLGPL